MNNMTNATTTPVLPAGFAPANIRSLRQTERSARIRSLLRAAGIRARVKSATGSMCFWSKVYVPADQVRAVYALIEAAFPDMADRSDLMTDHFDFMFTVSALREEVPAA
jgi:hypothetical protein